MDAHPLALLCQAVYAGDESQFDTIFDNGNVCVGRKGNVLAFRGSLTALDWFDDFEAIPVAVPLVGTVHEGFWFGVSDIFEQVGLNAGDKVIITGHSLGCAHAALFARLCLLRGILVEQLYLFAPPRIGYQDFYDGLRNVKDLKAWHNTSELIGDPVPGVPIVLPDEPWCQFPLIKICVPPDGIAAAFPMRWHNIALYASGV